jgi:hypothetical protein
MTTSQDPEMTGSYLICRYMRFGCTWVARWLPGGEQRARTQRIEHEKTCRFQYQQTRPS